LFRESCPTFGSSNSNSDRFGSWHWFLRKNAVFSRKMGKNRRKLWS
jgi:hypothetical protein